jgi:hypothetical protein
MPTFELCMAGLVPVLQLGLERLDLVLERPPDLVPMLLASTEVGFLRRTDSIKFSIFSTKNRLDKVFDFYNTKIIRSG